MEQTPMRPYVDAERCVACGVCVELCPVEPSVFDLHDVAVVARPATCIVCRACQDGCPVWAIVVR